MKKLLFYLCLSFGLLTSLLAQNTIYSDPVFDDFERDTLGNNWTIYNGDVGIVNLSDIGVITKTGPMNGLGIVAWNATIFSADQFSEGVITVDVDSNALYQVFVRRRTTDNQRYGFHWNPVNGGQWELKRDGGPGAPVLDFVSATKPLPGDTMMIEVLDSVLKGFHNGVEVISATDSVLTNPGQPGMALNVANVTVFPTPMFEFWTGGSLLPLGVDEDKPVISDPLSVFRLHQNTPNPFLSSTLIRYQVPSTNHETRITNHVSLNIYDITGRLVETLVNERQEPGVYQVQWDGRIPESGVRSGIYFYRLESGDILATKKMILLR
jgi:hypothetical protein